MPVDLSHSRFGPREGLGTPGPWMCPACGVQNDGRRPEQGCAHCGAGDPKKSQAGVESRVPTTKIEEGHRTHPNTVVPQPPGSLRPSVPAVEPLRILRLIEYLIKPGENADITLRRSLVGRMDLSWGTLTGTIVDSLNDRQEDLLRLARRQPGVWVSNTAAMEQADQQDKGRQPREPSLQPVPQRMFNPFAEAARERESRSDRMELPDTGPTFRPADAQFARMIVDQYGLKLAYTLALALSQIAPELENNMEPEKFITSEECLRLANAMMQLIPADWAGDAALEPPPDGPTA